MNCYYSPEDEIALRKAKESLAYYREAENEARRALTHAVESTKRAKEKLENLFDAAEKRVVARIKTSF